MRCKKHFSDVSSTVGICATCLRDRLLSVIAAQAHANAHDQPRTHDRARSDALARHDYRLPPPPLLFPRSVSPYVSRHSHDSRFYSTPQLQKMGSMTRGSSTAAPDHGGGKKGRWSRKLSFLQHLLVFRSRSDGVNSEVDHRFPSDSDRGSPNSSPSLFSLLQGRWKNRLQQGNPCYTDVDSNQGHTGRNWWATPDRGFPRDCNGGECCRGYSSDRTTFASVGRRRRGDGRVHLTDVHMSFCLSPLVRASPAGRLRNSSEVGYSGDVRAPASRRGANNCDW